MRDYVWLLLVVLASVKAQYFYPQPSPPFVLPPANPEPAPTTTAPPPPPPTVAPVVEEVTTAPPPPPTTAPPPPPTTTAPPPPPTTLPSYILCNPTEDCILASECSARQQPFNNEPNARCQNSFDGQIGVCCSRPPPPTTTLPPPPPPTTTLPPPPPPTTTVPPTPAPTTAAPPPAIEYLPPPASLPPPPPPTTTLPPPPPPTVAPVIEEVTTAPPPPPTTTAPPPPTTTQPAYILCNPTEDCILPSQCIALQQPFNNDPNARCQSPDNGLVGVCCSRPPPPTTTTTTTTTTTQPPFIQCNLATEDCVAPSVCSGRQQTFNNGPNARCQNSFDGQIGVCCNRPPPPTTTLPPPPAPTTTYAPPNLEYLPPQTSRPVPPTTENPLFPDANENQQVSILFPTAAPTTTAPPPPPPVVVVTTTAPPPPVVIVSTPAPPVVQPVLSESQEEILFWDFRESIPGEPELDYPIFDKIPVTSFTCDDKIDGYYADIEARCQVFHVCTNVPEAPAVKNSFLCPNGTVFNQENFACQWWPDVECATSPEFFLLNENIGKVPEKQQQQQQQVVIAAPAVPQKTAEPVIAIQVPVAVQPVIQAQAAVISQSISEPVAASATASVQVPAAVIQLESVDAPAVQVQLEPVAIPDVQVAYQPETVVQVQLAAEPVQAVVIPEPAANIEVQAPVEVPAPVVLSIVDEPVQEVVKITAPQTPSGLYEAPVASASSSGAQNKY